MAKRKIRWTNNVPDPVKSGPYEYGATDDYRGDEDVFKKDDIAQATPRELSILFSGRSKEKEPVKKWFTTQLEFYGVPFRKTASKPELREALELAFDAGKCHELAPAVAAIRDQLQRRFDDAWKRADDKQFATLKTIDQEANADPPRFLAKYFLDNHGRPDRSKTNKTLSFAVRNSTKELSELVADIPRLELIVVPRKRVLIGWDNTMQRGIETEFARLASSLPSIDDKPHLQAEQANIDLKLFLDRHLHIDPEGHSTRTGPRPLAPVLFCKTYLTNNYLPNNLAIKAPGLTIKEHGYISVIGWDAVRVDAEIGRLKEEERLAKEKQEAEAKAAREKKEAEKRSRWYKRSKPHRELVAKIKQNCAQAPPAFGLQLLPGRYLVRRDVDDFTGQDYNDPWNEHDLMTLNIFPPERNRKSHGLKASFFFGSIEGTMLLAMSRDKVVLLREAQRKDGRDYDHDEDELLDEEAGTSGSRYEEASFDVGFVSFPSVTSYSAVSTNGNQLGSSTTSLSTLAGAKRVAPVGSNIADPFGVLAARAKRQRMMEEAAAVSATVATTNKTTTPAVNMLTQERLKKEECDEISLSSLPPRRNGGNEGEDNETKPSTSPAASVAPSAPSQPKRYRVFFQLAYSMVDGYPYEDDRNEQIGHLDFDEYGTTAEGVFRLPALGDTVQRLSIFKVSNTPDRGKQPKEWCEFDGRHWGRW